MKSGVYNLTRSSEMSSGEMWKLESLCMQNELYITWETLQSSE